MTTSFWCSNGKRENLGVTPRSATLTWSWRLYMYVFESQATNLLQGAVKRQGKLKRAQTHLVSLSSHSVRTQRWIATGTDCAHQHNCWYTPPLTPDWTLWWRKGESNSRPTCWKLMLHSLTKCPKQTTRSCHGMCPLHGGSCMAGTFEVILCHFDF